MQSVHSFFYKKVFEAFDDNSIEAIKRKIYREKVGVKQVWQKREYPGKDGDKKQ